MRRFWRVPATLFFVSWSSGPSLASPVPLSEERDVIRIFAASSLTDALGEAIARFRQTRPDLRVVTQFGGSSDLARQILAGAPADLFFSADERQMDRVAEAGMVIDRKDVLSNELVIVTPRASSGSNAIASPEDLLRAPRIAMADPEVVPAGVYARQYLEARGLWDRVREKIVPTMDVRGALAAVAGEHVAAGIVYRTDASIEKRVRVAFAIPREEGPKILYPLARIAGRKESDAVRELFSFLGSAQAREVFERYGFVSVDDER